MFEDMLRAMERQSGESFAENGSARALWMNEWSKGGAKADEVAVQ